MDADQARSLLLTHIEGFVEVARRGNMRRAAKALYVSQPTVTAWIQGLEASVGSLLFRRSPAGMTLTPAGRAFLPYAERALATLRAGTTLVLDIERGAAGELAIGAVPAVSQYVLPELLGRFIEQAPRVRLLVRTGHSEDVLAAVAARDVVLGILPEVREGSLVSWPLYEDDVLLVVRRDHPFASRRQIDVRDLAATRLILFDRTSPEYGLTTSILRQAGVTPIGMIELDNIEAAKRMVERGLGVALLPGTAVADALHAGDLVAVDITGAHPMRRRIVAVSSSETADRTAAVEAFAQLLRRIPELIPGARTVNDNLKT